MISYAQNAEDVVLARPFIGRTDGFYVDLGAGDPTDCSVTRHFYELGWRGINVEPDPTLYRRLCKDRPRDVNLNVAVSDHEGTTSLYVAPPSLPGTSSLHPELLDPLPSNEGFQPLEVELLPLHQILDLHAPGPIDFLKVDVEGHEEFVILSGDWTRHSPRVVVVEATVPHTPIRAAITWERVLQDAGYVCTLFDGLNRFYAKSDDGAAVEALSAPANIFDDFELYRWTSRLDSLNEDLRRSVQKAENLQAEADSLERRLEETQHLLREALADRDQLAHLRQQVCDLAREVRRVVGLETAK
jgi:FkbM family methyltransferase